MTFSILVTKLFIPPTRPELVPRPRLVERLDEGLHRKLSLISAPAGFGKTTLVTEWLDNIRGETRKGTQTDYRIAWLSLMVGLCQGDLTISSSTYRICPRQAAWCGTDRIYA
jgi:LuxR family maltose regulon positive regulatory protein